MGSSRPATLHHSTQLGWGLGILLCLPQFPSGFPDQAHRKCPGNTIRLETGDTIRLSKDKIKKANSSVGIPERQREHSAPIQGRENLLSKTVAEREPGGFKPKRQHIQVSVGGPVSKALGFTPPPQRQRLLYSPVRATVRDYQILGLGHPGQHIFQFGPVLSAACCLIGLVGFQFCPFPDN